MSQLEKARAEDKVEVKKERNERAKKRREEEEERKTIIEVMRIKRRKLDEKKEELEKVIEEMKERENRIGREGTLERERVGKGEVEKELEEMRRELIDNEKKVIKLTRKIEEKEKENQEMKDQMVEKDNVVSEQHWVVKGLETRLEEVQRTIEMNNERLWIGIIWEIIKVRKDKMRTERERWHELVSQICSKNGVKDWRLRLGEMDKGLSFTTAEKGGSGRVKNPEAYNRTPEDLWRYLRNQQAHNTGRHATQGDRGLYNWADRIWPWLWPAVVKMSEKEGWLVEYGDDGS